MIEQSEKRRPVALITGASSGIGREFARRLARNGYDVVLVARRTERIQELARELEQGNRIRATAIQADLSAPNSVKQVYSEVVGKNIEISILVNNAGFNVYGPFTQTDADDEMRMLQVNVMAVVALTKLFAHDMVERGFGRILNLASTASFTPAPFDSLYAASKAFVLSFTESLSEELKGTGVTVTALCPGPTDTEFAARAGMSDTKIFSGRLMTAPQVVSIGYRALMRGQTIAVTGFANKLLLFFIRLTPRAIVAKIAKNLMSRQAPALEPNAHRA